MLSLVSLLALAPSALAGTWSGSVMVHTPDGHIENGIAILWVGQGSDHLMGSIGETETHQSALRNVRSVGEDLTFDFDIHEGMPISVHLSEIGGHLKGGGNSAVSIDFDLQPAPTLHTLYEQVVRLDGKLFSAYNHRDLTTIEGLFAKNLEFFHDKDGLSGYQQNMDSFRRLFAESTRYRRELDEASLEVYPVKGYGAMEVGIHRFYAQLPGKPEQLTATAKFVHVWTDRDGTWKISRVVSYDHR